MKTLRQLFPLFLALATPASAMTNSFTFQGRLSADGVPVNDMFSMQFVLHAHSTQGDGLGLILLPEVPVTNGLFTAQLAFAPQLFDGGDRWLSLHLRRAADAGAPFTELTPRQPLTPAPYALVAKTVPEGSIGSQHLAAGSVGTAQIAPGAVSWSDIANKPATLADGVDNDTTYAAGGGLSLNAASQFSVNFGGNGTNVFAARSDHGHYGQSWTGSGYSPGLLVSNTLNYGRAITGVQGTGSGLSPNNGPVAAVRGDSSDGDGVVGESNLRGVVGRVAGTNALNYGVIGFSQSTRGHGVYGQASQTSGTNYGGAFYSHSPDGVGVKGVAYATEIGGSFAGQFENRGYGHGIQATSSRGTAAQFDVTNEISIGPSLIARNQGRGTAGMFIVDNDANANSAVSAQSNGTGDALKSLSSGTGDAADFTVLGSTTNRAAMRAVAYAGNKAVHAENTSSVAVYAKTGGGRAVEASATTGTALYGRATSSGGTALEIGGGAIRVAGAGVNTGTAAFIHRVSSSNTSFDETANIGEAETWINHPMCNNNPGAILIATPRYWVGGGFAVMPPLGVAYDASSGRWVISNGSADEYGDFDSGDEINVLIILP